MRCLLRTLTMKWWCRVLGTWMKPLGPALAMSFANEPPPHLLLWTVAVKVAFKMSCFKRREMYVLVVIKRFAESLSSWEKSLFFFLKLHFWGVFVIHEVQTTEIPWKCLINVRPQLVKSLVIVIHFCKTEMHDAVIINYWLLLYSYSTGKNGSQIIGLTLIS